MWREHPKGLAVLFFTEMWERFSYYGMRAIFVLYMIKALMFDVAKASNIYGNYTGLVYLTPLLGGYIADRWWGNRRSILVGGVIMAVAQFFMFLSASSYQNPAVAVPLMWAGLTLLIAGNGLFKPNISSMVGSLYPEGDRRIDSAFTIFYMGINIGAFLSPLVAGGLGDTGNPADFRWGFLSACVGMIIGTVIFAVYKNRHVVDANGHPLGLPPSQRHADSADRHEKRPLTREEKDRIAVIFILSFFVIAFWAAFEQAGASLTVFADQQTNRQLLGWTVPASYFQSINPVAIVLFAPLFATMWTKLGQRGLEPSSPLKMALGLFLLALGYVVIAFGVKGVGPHDKVSMMWLVSLYLLHTWGELCLSPIGLSAVSKLAPAHLASLMMGVWFGATALSNKMAGVLSSLYPEPGKPYPVLLGWEITGLYDFFVIFIVMAAVSGVILLLLYRRLLRMMHGLT